MSSNLSLKIRSLIEEKNLSVQGLEKKSGLKLNAVRNILIGHSKKPSAETLLAISRALGCTIGELLDEESSSNNRESARIDLLFENKELLHDVIDCILEYMTSKNIPIKNKEFYESIEKIYQYSVRKFESTLDKEFAEWYLDDRF